jgi:hypothetical protein
MFKPTIITIRVPERPVPCSADVLMWNYWDGEHLVPVHAGYTYAYNLYQGTNYTLSIIGTKAPFIPISIPTIAFVVQHKQNIQFTYALQLFLLSKTTISVAPATDDSCHVSVEYKFSLPWPLGCLGGVLKRLSLVWFERVYNEDMPIRLRRQKVLNAGFVDYHGISDGNRQPYKFQLPIIPSSGSPLLEHPFYESNVKRSS